MIDLVMYGSRANLRALLKSRGLIEVNAGEVTKLRGFDYCEWAGSGKFMTSPGVDSIPPTFLPQTVILARITTAEDEIDAPADGELWNRSKVARYIKNNGTPGLMGTITYYELDGVRLFRAADVFAWLDGQGLPGHEWLGGNNV